VLPLAEAEASREATVTHRAKARKSGGNTTGVNIGAMLVKTNEPLSASGRIIPSAGPTTPPKSPTRTHLQSKDMGVSTDPTEIQRFSVAIVRQIDAV
jgi:hypothetical protein